MTVARAIEQLNSRERSLLQLYPLKCNFIIYQPRISSKFIKLNDPVKSMIMIMIQLIF
jgi:hypothetical protein